MNKCIKRFNLNPEFYTNSIKDGHINEEKYYDKDMKRFLEYRNKSLIRLSKKEEFENDLKHVNSRRFSHVESVLFKKTGDILGLETFKNTIRTEFSKLPTERK